MPESKLLKDPYASMVSDECSASYMPGVHARDNPSINKRLRSSRHDPSTMMGWR